MITIILISAGVGALVGAGLGWKLGRGYEKIRPNKKDKKRSR